MNMDLKEISKLAEHIRSTYKEQSNKFSISVSILHSIVSSIFTLEEPASTSFHNNSQKIKLIKELQFLQEFFKKLTSLKIYGDGSKPVTVDLGLCESLITLELSGFDAKLISGLMNLKPHLQRLTCQRSCACLSDIFDRTSQPWKELRHASFTHGSLKEVDESLEIVPPLHTLDLSHNQIDNANALTCVVNLKHLNLSYNKLTRVPHWNGQMCSRMQHLIINNNFIEDVSDLAVLTNLFVLDLGNNCIVDHKSLVGLTQLATLQWLNLRGNPLSFHPHHRTRTAIYLHVNTASVNFVLDGTIISPLERQYVGRIRLKPKVLERTSERPTPIARVRKVREVVIEDETTSCTSSKASPTLSSTPQDHLETKKQIEELREQYGESWLRSHSGVLVQSVLGLESTSLPVSQSPYDVDFLIHSDKFNQAVEDVAVVEEPVEETVDSATVELTEEVSEAEISDSESIQGEENLYLVTVEGENEPIFVVITDKHISERECLTSKEQGRWHVDSILSCKILEDGKTVQIDYDTMRRDRKQRKYVFDGDEEQFVNLVNERMHQREPRKNSHTNLQCMKCSAIFPKPKHVSILSEDKVSCPTCDSNVVVDHV